MFALHETTQRRVCRVSFLVLCVVPTVLTLAAIAYCNRPWRESDWQRTLASSLHLRATIEAVSRPKPGTTVLTNLRLGDLQTDTTLGWVDKLRFQQSDSRLLLQAGQLELQSEQLSTLMGCVRAWLATGEVVPLDLRADQVLIADSTWPALALQNLSIRSESTGQDTWCFTIVAESPSGETIKIKLNHEQGELRCIVDAQQAALPAWLVGQMVPGMRGCGEAKFTGVIDTATSPHEQRGKLTGTLNQVEMRSWSGSALHQIHGAAKIVLDHVAWENGTLELARGGVTANRGAITYSMLMAMQEVFACAPGPAFGNLQAATPEQLVPFEQMVLKFDLGERGLEISGNESDQLLLSAEGPLLLVPQPSPLLPIARLVRLFHQPTRHGWLPGTQAAHEMAEKLPLPEETAQD